MISVAGRERTLFLALADCYPFLDAEAFIVALRVGNSTHKGSKMSSLSKQEQLRQLIDEQQERIRQTFPAHRGKAVVALTRARDCRYLTLQDTPKGAPAYNSYLYSSGWHKAVQFCFGNAAESASVSPLVIDSTLDVWADQVLLECDCLSAGEQVLAYCETGFMRLQQGGQ